MDDEQLLRQYVETRSHEAFAALVARHTDLVWSSALRLVGGDPHAAEDVAQTVFATLAAKAPRLKPGVVLPGWLLTATRYAAADLRKAERRRKIHERKAMSTSHAEQGGAAAANEAREECESAWAHVAPVLDDALAQLSESLRLAVVLRFFERRSMRDVAGRLGISEQAARQRVCRGLDRLRDALGRKSAALPAAALAALLTTHAVQAAPAGASSALASGAWLTSAAGAKGLAGAGGALWLLGGWAKATAAACVLLALIGSVGAVVALELRGKAAEETVRLAPPSAPDAARRISLPFNGASVVPLPPGGAPTPTGRKDFVVGVGPAGQGARFTVELSATPSRVPAPPARTNAPPEAQHPTAE
jgi:RNA polymerase sigma factor (sigma-70 family)